MPVDCDLTVFYVSRKHPPSVGGMQRLSQRLLAEIRQRVTVRAIVRDSPRRGLGLFLVWAAALLVVGLVKRIGRRSVVHLGDPALIVLAPLCATLRASVVVTVHGLDVTYPNSLYQFLLSIGLPFVSTFVCISEAAKDQCRARGIGEERLAIITPGVDIPGERPGDAKQELARLLGLPSVPGTILLTVGRLVPRKGVAWFTGQVLPQLVGEENDIVYVVVGEGPERNRVASAARQAGVEAHLRLLGEVPDGVLDLCLAAADIFVMPNVPVLGDMEGFGLVSLEASARGCVVVAADLEGITSAITPLVNGLLLPAEDVPAFRQTILDLVRAPVRRQELGIAFAEATLSKFSWATMGEAYARTYAALAC